MDRFLSARDKIYLTIALSGDFFGGADFAPVPVAILFDLYTKSNLASAGVSGESQASFNQAIFRGLKSKQVEKVSKDNDASLKLTTVGRKVLFHDFPQLEHRGEDWDKQWRIVTFDIGEADRSTRDNLREKLKKLGFGTLQESLYLSPFPLPEDLNDFLDTGGLLDRVHIFEAKVQGGREREMADRVWKLAEINRRYKKILVSYKQSGDRVETANKYLETFALDPLLPKELLPSDWSADRVKKLLRI